MTATNKMPEDDSGPVSRKPSLRSLARAIGIGLGVTVTITALTYTLWNGHWVTGRMFSLYPITARTDPGPSAGTP